MLVIRSIWVYQTSTGRILHSEKVRIDISKKRFNKLRNRYDLMSLSKCPDCVLMFGFVEKGFKLKDKGYEKS